MNLFTKCLFLNDESCMLRPNLIGMNPFELEYYQFMISLNKCTGCCDLLFPKMCVPKETKDINVKAFNMITNKNEAKAMKKHISCDYNTSSIEQRVIQNKNGINLKLFGKK